ncbi:MAG: alpha/beta hydrolase [Chloroflexota bacterium]|nr:alpha/beta hydrolase [Chloroflexota bacterium]
MTQAIQTPIIHRFIPTNGIQLHVAQAGDPANELVILLHGFPEFWYGWRGQIDALVEAGYYVWCPDQRGYNLSDKPAGVAAYQIDALAADIVGLIDAAGREKVYLVGHDWGAAVAWHIAIHYPDRLKKLAILNVPHPQVMTQTLRTNPEQILKSWYMGFFQTPLLPEGMFLMGDANIAAASLFATSRPGTFTDADIPEYIKAWKQRGAATAMINWYRALVRHQPDMRGDQRVRVPTLIIWGVEDRFLSASMTEPSRAMCDDGQLVLIDGASHWVQHEEAARVNALLIAHFNR